MKPKFNTIQFWLLEGAKFALVMALYAIGSCYPFGSLEHVLILLGVVILSVIFHIQYQRAKCSAAGCS